MNINDSGLLKVPNERIGSP